MRWVERGRGGGGGGRGREGGEGAGRTVLFKSLTCVAKDVTDL